MTFVLWFGRVEPSHPCLLVACRCHTSTVYKSRILGTSPASAPCPLREREPGKNQAAQPVGPPQSAQGNCTPSPRASHPTGSPVDYPVGVTDGSAEGPTPLIRNLNPGRKSASGGNKDGPEEVRVEKPAGRLTSPATWSRGHGLSVPPFPPLQSRGTKGGTLRLMRPSARSVGKVPCAGCGALTMTTSVAVIDCCYSSCQSVLFTVLESERW